MKYKNVVFDFGNVIGGVDGRYMLEQFCPSSKDCDLLMPAVYARWNELDRGTLDYEEYVEHTVSAVPARLEEAVREFFPRLAGLYQSYPGYRGTDRGTL